MQKIILATTSPYRLAKFRDLGIEFDSEASNVDEKFKNRPQDPKKLVSLLSKLKARNVAQNHKSGIVIGFDSVGYFSGRVLEKPSSKKEEKERLLKMSGKSFSFHTGVTVIDIKKKIERTKVVDSIVKIRRITESEIDKYLKQDPKFNTYACGFDPVGHYSSTFIIDLKGSYNNFLIGLPLETVVDMLNSLR